MILGELKKGTPGPWGTFVSAMWALGGRRGYIVSWGHRVCLESLGMFWDLRALCREFSENSSLTCEDLERSKLNQDGGKQEVFQEVLADLKLNSHGTA